MTKDLSMLRSIFLAGASTALLPTVGFAQTAEPAPHATRDASEADAAPQTSPARAENEATEPHADHTQDIVVTGFHRNRSDVLSGMSVVSGVELVRDLRPTIGETLARQPGVSATSFGPNASRPVLRGFQGERVRVLTDGIGSLDASNTSVDHAVAVNPLTAQRIEVLRGPGALLLGSGAIGGVVNVIDARIPRHIPDETAHIEGIVTYGSGADERSGNATVDVPVGGGFVLHADGNYSKTNDLGIGGFVLSRRLRAEAAASADPEIRDLAELRGRLSNTAAETSDVALGAAWISGENNVGLSVNRYDSLYGVPIRPSLDPTEAAEAPRIDIKQTRVDGRAEIDAGSGFVDNLRFRAGYSDHRHNELEESGDIGTTFLTNGAEGRLEFVQSQRGAWGGGFGAQYFQRSLDVIGEEKFLPENKTNQVGLFTVQNYRAGPIRAEIGARYEHQKVSAAADADLGNPAQSRSFDSYSASAGASYEIARASGSASMDRTRSGPPRPKSCSRTARTPARRPSRSATQLSSRKRAGASKGRSMLRGTATICRHQSSKAGSTATSTRREPEPSRTGFPSFRSRKPMRVISVSSWKALSGSRRSEGSPLTSTVSQITSVRRSTQSVRPRASRRCGCSAASRRNRKSCRAGLRSSGPMPRIGSPSTRRRRTASRW